MTAPTLPLDTALHTLADAPAAYPPALLAARRAEFRARVQAHNSNSDRLDAIARALPTADNPDELIEEAAEILSSDYMDDFGGYAVSDEQDERNSRPFPY